MTATWQSPKVGDIVLLSTGFSPNGQDAGPHYGLVLGLVKVQDDPSKRLVIVAPGSTDKSGKQIKNQVVLDDACFSRPTRFFLGMDFIRVYEYPSDEFEESRTSNPGTHSAIVSNTKSIQKARSEILNNYRDGFAEFFSIVFKNERIDIKDLDLLKSYFLK